MSAASTNKSTTVRKSKTNGQPPDGSAGKNGNHKTNGQAGTDYFDQKQFLSVLTAVKKGDFAARLPDDETGITGKIYDALNEIIEKNEQLTAELGRVSEVVGKEGKIAQRAALNHATGGWASCIGSVNTLITDLAQPTTEVARVIGAVAEGDLSQNFNLEIDGRPLKGEFLRTGKTVNTMVTQLGAFASEVTRVAREVGNRRKTRRTGAGQRRFRHLEGFDRKRELNGVEPDRASSQHR